MSRKTILWIIAGVLAAAVVVVVGALAYHMGFDHGSPAVMHGPSGYGYFSRRFTAFPAGLLLLLVLIAGAAIGAAVVYAFRSQAAATVGSTPGGPTGPRTEAEWRRFEQWHQYAHGSWPAAAASTAPLASAAPSPPATGTTTEPGTVTEPTVSETPSAGHATPPPGGGESGPADAPEADGPGATG
jgi:hypothetical protein